MSSAERPRSRATRYASYRTGEGLTPSRLSRSNAVRSSLLEGGTRYVKFLCDQCKTKYQIADEKAAGKTLRMKCRKCGHLIEVRAATAATTIASTPPPAGPSPAAPPYSPPGAPRPGAKPP